MLFDPTGPGFGVGHNLDTTAGAWEVGMFRSPDIAVKPKRKVLWDRALTVVVHLLQGKDALDDNLG